MRGYKILSGGNKCIFIEKKKKQSERTLFPRVLNSKHCGLNHMYVSPI